MNRDKKVHIVLGTKAQLIKMAPVMIELQKRHIPYRFIFTGQHHETVDELLQNFGIKKPDIVLHEGRDITGIFQMAGWMAKILWKIVRDRKTIFGEDIDLRDVVLTHGDTFSTLLGALMGRFAGIQVAHVESGLRSFHIFHPFPEELTRLAVFRLSDMYFCPGEWAVQNLEAYRGVKVNTQVNTLYDALQLIKTLPSNLSLEIPQEPFCVFSIHRFENIFKRDQLELILGYLRLIAQQMRVLFILHPPTAQQLKQFGLMDSLESMPNIELRPRYNYTDFIRLVSQGEFLVTDGGSNQEECSYLGKPCLLMRKATERQEGLGESVVLSEYKEEVIRDFLLHYDRYRREPLSLSVSPSERIIQTLYPDLP